MHPLLYERLHIEWYPALVLLGYFAGWFLVRWRAKNSGIDPRHVDNLVLLILVTGLAGGRLAARLFYAPHISFIDSFKIWRGGGLVFYGGFIAGALTVIFYARAKKLRLVKLLDVFAPGASLGLAFGRIGCFMAGCCWGDLCLPPGQRVHLPPATEYQVETLPALSPGFLGVRFPIKSAAYRQHTELGLLQPTSLKSLPVHPVQLYESLFAFLLTIWLCRRKPLFEGEIAIRMLVGYSVGRFVLEFFRADNQPNYLGMTISQVTSVLLLAIAIGFTVWRVRAGGVPYTPHPANART